MRLLRVQRVIPQPSLPRPADARDRAVGTDVWLSPVWPRAVGSRESADVEDMFPFVQLWCERVG